MEEYSNSENITKEDGCLESSNAINKKPSVKKNYIYNLIYQIFLLIVPLVTTPYISRVLLADGVGKYSFSHSIMCYFTMFASLGFGYYAQREIAKYQGNIEKQTTVFFEIIICRLLPVSISLIVNLILWFTNVYGDYSLLMLIFSLNIINVAFDISFLFQGNEKFKSIIFINVFIKSLAILLIFLFVKNENHVWVFTLINSLALLLSTIFIWLPARKLLCKVSIKSLKPFKHLKGTLILFLPTIAVSIYTILDKTLIGVLIKDTFVSVDSTGAEVIKKYSDIENGFYEQSEKIVKLVMTIITAIGIVMIPRNTNEFASGNFDKVKENIYKTSKFVLFIGIPMVLGLILSSNLFVPWFFGDGYDKCIVLIKIMSPLILIIGFSNVFGLQFLIPSGKDKYFTICLLVGALVNLTMNIILIPFLWSVGASIATIVGELSVTALMAIFIRKDISFFRILKSGFKYYIAGIVMFIALFFLLKFFDASIIMTFLYVLTGITIYICVLLILHDELLFNFINKGLKFFKKNG